MENFNTERALQWLNDRVEISELITALARGLSNLIIGLDDVDRASTDGYVFI